MPGGDGTGPLGKGPGAGCRGGAGRGVSGFRGKGRGMWRCRQWALLSGEARGGQDVYSLEEQQRILQQEMEMVQGRLKEIRGE
jgi:hypothetical protein